MVDVKRRTIKRNKSAKIMTSTNKIYEIAAAYPILPKVSAVLKIYMVNDSVAEPGPPPVVTTITSMILKISRPRIKIAVAEIGSKIGKVILVRMTNAEAPSTRAAS